MRAVLDVNVLVSALLSKRGAPSRILLYWEARTFEVVMSDAILDELQRVLQYPKIRNRLHSPDSDLAEYSQTFRIHAYWVQPQERMMIVRDESDNRYLEAAVAGAAQFIVSGDDHLLKLGQYQGIQIVSPTDFDATLASANPDLLPST